MCCQREEELGSVRSAPPLPYTNVLWLLPRNTEHYWKNYSIRSQMHCALTLEDFGALNQVSQLNPLEIIYWLRFSWVFWSLWTDHLQMFSTHCLHQWIACTYGTDLHVSLTFAPITLICPHSGPFRLTVLRDCVINVSILSYQGSS